MKAYKLELLVIDFDNLGGDQIKSTIENTSYPNRCISPSVETIQEADIGVWGDDHPLNKRDTAKAEYERLFAAERTTAPVSLTDEQAWTIITEICGTQLTRVGSRKFQVIEINDMATAGEVARALLAAAPAPIQQEPVGYVSQSATSLLMEYRGEGLKTSMRIYSHPEPEREITVPLYAEALAGSQVQAAGDAVDAARYRWLRDKARSVDWTRNLSPNSYTTACRNSANQMDTAIDAAMREQP